MTPANPLSPAELAEVQGRWPDRPLMVERLLATIAAEQDRCAVLAEEITALRGELAQAENAALERAAAWHDEQYNHYRKLKNQAVATKRFMELANIEMVHELSAQAIRELKTKE